MRLCFACLPISLGRITRKKQASISILKRSVMSSSSIIVRPLASSAEYELHFQFADQEFSPDPSPASALYVQRVTTTRPEFRPEQLRWAFRNGEQIGSYIIYEWALRMRAARLATRTIRVRVGLSSEYHTGVHS